MTFLEVLKQFPEIFRAAEGIQMFTVHYFEGMLAVMIL